MKSLSGVGSWVQVPSPTFLNSYDVIYVKMQYPKIEYGSIGRFYLSLGVFCFFGSGAVFTFVIWKINENNIAVFLDALFPVNLIFGIIGAFYMILGLVILLKEENRQEMYQFDVHVKNILDQDSKLLELKAKQLDYNMKVDEYNKNKKNKEKLAHVEWRELKDIVEQARNTKYYEDVFPKKKKSFWPLNWFKKR